MLVCYSEKYDILNYVENNLILNLRYKIKGTFFRYLKSFSTYEPKPFILFKGVDDLCLPIFKDFLTRKLFCSPTCLTTLCPCSKVESPDLLVRFPMVKDTSISNRNWGAYKTCPARTHVQVHCLLCKAQKEERTD